MDALAFLAKPAGKVGPLYVLHGDESFLKRQALAALRERALGADGDEAAVSTHPGDKAQFAAVWDELQTAPFFAPRRLVVVDNADPFVTRFRALLEKKVTALPATGVLVLDVKLWQSNTRLAKLVDSSATIVCKAPGAYKLPAWCADWSAARYQKALPPAAAQLLVDLAGAEMGQLDQELHKLAIYVGDKARIDVADVDQLVGRSRAENVWKIFDALAAGKPAEALQLLDRLLELGEEPMKILGAFSSQLRRLAQAGRLAVQGMPLGAAVNQAGFQPFVAAAAEKHLRRLGRHRAARLYDWLMEIYMGLRGESSLPQRTQFERLVLRLAAREGDRVTG
ncbi:MAG: DNA polymerase III subunit delta [Gemmataceae bacterium]|nr:DNA polymerase III subunit delta [Gemmataceae bacterium]